MSTQSPTPSATKKINIDLFDLHYKITVGILASCAAVLGIFPFFKNPIDCAVDVDDSLNFLSNQSVNNYCWSQTFFYKENEDGEYTEPYHQHLKWLSLYLFLLTFAFHLSCYSWKSIEGNRMKNYISKINSNGGKTEPLALILMETFRRKCNNYYVWKYLFSNILRALILYSHLFVINIFIGSEFTTYGLDVFNFLLYSGDDNPMARVFPKTVACVTPWDINVVRVICALSINSINDKIFFSLWLWFACLSILTTLYLLFWIYICFSKRVRSIELILLMSYNGKPLTEALKSKIELLVSFCTIGDWFILSLLGRNLDGPTFKSLLLALSIPSTENNGCALDRLALDFD